MRPRPIHEERCHASSAPPGRWPSPSIKRNAIPNASWGLHLVDANIALGNLVSIVSTEATAFAKRASGGRKG